MEKEDYTEGLKFFPWLIKKDSGRYHFLAAMGLTLAGIILFLTLEESYAVAFQIGFGIFCTLAGIFLMFWTYRMYRQFKNGISS